MKNFHLFIEDVNQHDGLQEESSKRNRTSEGTESGHTSGWVKVPVGTKDKLYLDDPTNKFKNVIMQQYANLMS